MKKFLLPFFAAALCTGAAMAEGGNSVLLKGAEWSVDTTFHAKIGPGTTQTSLRLWNGTNGLNVYYLTIDITQDNVKMRTVCAKDKVAGNATTSSMAQTHSTATSHYFAGSNGDFYTTAGNATNGTSIVGTPTNALTSDRQVYRTSDRWRQFAYDINGKCYITRLNYKQGTATCGEQTVPFKVINNNSASDGVSLYTSLWYGSTNQQNYADKCAEVTAKLVEGENFWAGCAYKMEITSEPSRTGDLTIPAGEFVIHGRGSGDTFVSSLKVGDIVTLDNVTLTEEGEKIYPACVVSGNPKNIGGGEWLDTEHERGDACDRHPRTGIGFNTEQTKLVLMVIDGRIGTSIGVTTGELGHMLMYAGCDEGMNLDGGGSSTLYTEALGVRNHCSDGKERSVSNAIFAVLEAPEDDNIAEINFYDNAPTLPSLALYTPQMMSFNKYGICLNTDFKDYTLSCPAELGEIINDGKTLYITATEGMYALTAHYGEYTASIPILIGDVVKETGLTYHNIVIDNDNPYEIRLYAVLDYQQLPLNPMSFSWKSADESIATVGDDGIIHGVTTGKTQVIGKRGELELVQNVSVENVDQDVLAIAPADSIAKWASSKSNLKDVVITTIENGLAFDYTVSSARGPKLSFTSKTFTYGVPKSLRFRVKPGASTIAKLTVNLMANNSSDLISPTFENLTPNADNELYVNLDEWFDTTDMGIYPIQLYSFAFAIGDAKGTVSHVDVPGIEQVYTDMGGVESVIVDNDALKLAVIDGVAYLNAPAKLITVTDLAGRVLATGSGSEIALPEGQALLLISADGRTAKVSK